MSNLSKYYNVALMTKGNCRDITHANRTCWQYATKNIIHNFVITAKFFAPMVCVCVPNYEPGRKTFKCFPFSIKQIQFLRQLASGFSWESVREMLRTCVLLTLSSYMGSVFGQSLTCVF